MIASRTPATFTLLVTLMVVFAIELTTGAVLDPVQLRRMGALTASALRDGEYWRLICPLFLHFGFSHLLWNSWSLAQLGGLFEEAFGSPRLLVTWFGSGTAASLVSSVYLAPGSLAGGASGAICGIAGALFGAMSRSPYWRQHPITRGLLMQIGIVFIGNLLMGLFSPMIDNPAHFGGLGAGFVIGAILHREPSWAVASQNSRETNIVA